MERFSPICNSKMKSITKYLKESFEQVNEGKDRYFYFTFVDLENADETIESIVHIANTKGLYYEKIDDGIIIPGRFLCFLDLDNSSISVGNADHTVTS